ncbi:CAP domain-containing protein [Paenibacillus macerans]|uniref:CAP domain-containing protein n=1 Tax=Paenibacillus macerans TaxID=44252 RepID=UPI00203DE055|nr:CAP domain-containing protein [Paenibacillus macerans]MCM3701891.1 CAP domain-containing protein [Paenibacillus macerans]
MRLDNRKGPFAARKRGRSVIAGAGALLLLLTGWFGGGAFGAAPHAYAADSGESGYTRDQLEAVDFLNEVRAKIGVQPLTLNRVITQAAEAHAKYYNANKEDHPGADAHWEKEGNEGFTGTSVIERFRAAGWDPKNIAFGEVMHFKQNSSTSAVQAWLDTAYHRDIILSPQFSEIGIGLVDGTAVVDMGVTGTEFASAITGGIAGYPYDGQTGVPVGFYGKEIPNPLDQFGVEYSGYIISATTETQMTSYEAKIKDEDGEEVAYFEELHARTLFLFPKKVLKGNHTYTVTLNYRTEASSGNQTQTWSFTTGKGPSLIALKPVLGVITLNEGGPHRLSFQGKLSDGRSEAAESGITFVSSNPKGLQISADGVLTGLKAGDYTVKATLDGTTTEISVKVYPKWKTKTYSGAAANLPSDISGHPLQASLEWGLKGGVISPAKDGLLHPDETVSEAEFWTMLLKTYSVNIDAYQPAKATHWADGAYAIAKSRNYPLAGIANAATRSNPVTRKQVAEIIAAADGVNAKGSNAITYVLAKDYMQGVTELSISGFESSKQLTRGEALQILQHLRQTLGELRGRPMFETPADSLPKLPLRKLYVKPAELEDRSLFTEYREDRKLVLEGKFKEFAGQSMMLKVQEKRDIKSMHIEDVNVTFDSEGKFHVEAGPYAPEALNLYLYAPEITYFISVQYNTFVDNHYSE